MVELLDRYFERFVNKIARHAVLIHDDGVRGFTAWTRFLFCALTLNDYYVKTNVRAHRNRYSTAT